MLHFNLDELEIFGPELQAAWVVSRGRQSSGDWSGGVSA